MSRLIDLTGCKFGMLTPYEYMGNSKWRCLCDCGKISYVLARNLKNKSVQSCGCNRYKAIAQKLRRPIQYIIDGNTAICKTASGVEFYVDAEDIDKISDRSWTIAQGGYICGKIWGVKEKVPLHKYLLGIENSKICVDHKDRNKMNNRKSNLRVCTRFENSQNYGIKKNNTSGFTGVYLNKRNGKWVVKITENHNEHNLGCYVNYEDAVMARYKGEIEYFKEFAPHTLEDVRKAIANHRRDKNETHNDGRLR